MYYFHQVSFTYELSREESSNNRSPFLDRVERERKVKFVKIDSQTVYIQNYWNKSDCNGKKISVPCVGLDLNVKAGEN